MNEFTLRITLGNEAMQTPEDVAANLRAVANQMDYCMGRQSGKILDYNGNVVGEWGFTK